MRSPVPLIYLSRVCVFVMSQLQFPIGVDVVLRHLSTKWAWPVAPPTQELARQVYYFLSRKGQPSLEAPGSGSWLQFLIESSAYFKPYFVSSLFGDDSQRAVFVFHINNASNNSFRFGLGIVLSESVGTKSTNPCDLGREMISFFPHGETEAQTNAYSRACVRQLRVWMRMSCVPVILLSRYNRLEK